MTHECKIELKLMYRHSSDRGALWKLDGVFLPKSKILGRFIGIFRVIKKRKKVNLLHLTKIMVIEISYCKIDYLYKCDFGESCFALRQ